MKNLFLFGLFLFSFSSLAQENPPCVIEGNVDLRVGVNYLQGFIGEERVLLKRLQRYGQDFVTGRIKGYPVQMQVEWPEPANPYHKQLVGWFGQPQNPQAKALVWEISPDGYFVYGYQECILPF